MVLSMTGYGKATLSFESKKISVELRSLNSKSLDLNLRMPTIYREKELELRSIILSKLERGKVDCSIQIESSHAVAANVINKELAKSYFLEMRAIANDLQVPYDDLFAQVLRLPEVVSSAREELTEEEALILLQTCDLACDSLNVFRKKEGEQLENDFNKNIEGINHLLLMVPAFEAERIVIVRERMKSAIQKLTSLPIDENRFEQELIFYIEKMDISEEKMRLKNHLDYFAETMKLPVSGKKLGFITQEIGREINTLGSKSYHVEMQKLVVEMKDLLEKIKEQVLNSL